MNIEILTYNLNQVLHGKKSLITQTSLTESIYENIPKNLCRSTEELKRYFEVGTVDAV